MLQASRRSYVCWRCAIRQVGFNATTSRSGARDLTQSSPSVARLTSPLSKRNFATVQHRSLNHDDSEASTVVETANRLSIRERLRKWEEENPATNESIVVDDAPEGGLSNSFTRPQNVSMAQLESSTPVFDGDELGDLRSDSTAIKAGDLVEISSDNSRRPMLAVSLGRVNGYENYYTNSGKWFAALGIRTLFRVSNFADMKDLEPVIAEIPTGEVSVETLNEMQDLGQGPSRMAGAGLLQKMTAFAQDAEVVYQDNAGTLDASSSFIGDTEKHRYLTLHEIAELLLPDTHKMGEVKGTSEDRLNKFSPQSLYAVHRAIMQDEVFFRPLKDTGHRKYYLFEVSPLNEVNLVREMELWVRGYLARRARRSKQGERNGDDYKQFNKFIANAQRAIDQSRERREWSETGIIGPSSGSAPAAHVWSAADEKVLRFMEIWAGYGKFPKHSRLQTLGSAILRALGRYQDANLLSTGTGWTFLQEVGWIPPWEIPARYSVRFPEVEIKRGGGYTRPFNGLLEEDLNEDALSVIRKPLENVTAYCIDDIEAMEIDDAVSLERTENPDESWIHVHVADPASAIKPETPLAKYAELIPETIYLPGHFEPMLPENLSRENFSLGSNRPCLTFSALVKADGRVLEHKITAGSLKDVVYMTYEDAALAIGESQNAPKVEGTEAALELGSASRTKVVNREMTKPSELTDRQKYDLVILSQLGKVIQAQRLEKGATPFFQPRPSARASFDSVTQKASNGYISTSGDPAIHIAYSHRSATDLVENAMKLGNEIAARWCAERSIPIPYRTQPHAYAQGPELVLQYARDVINPLLNAGIRPSDSQMRHMRALLGADEVRTTPGFHFTLGVEMYTKATSPLRRFADLIVHWQIEAALLEEHRLGRSLAGCAEQSLDFLPYSKERLDRLLPMLRLREQQARTLSNVDGMDQWILQALARAWRFGEAPLPPTFRFAVVHVAGRRQVLGTLNWFDRRAFLRPDALNDVVRMADIRVGDVFEVKLKDVNVHGKTILVEAVQILDRAGGKSAEHMGGLAGAADTTKDEKDTVAAL
ncbi:hypothetical protein F5Y15DRAFT_196313 [Xylariaceae sp. FL0016]|nr:hypothetical protein F5Y15DRAFT_196313 [Xylariaceae sp. FL0016]